MSKYTTEVRYICEHLSGLDVSKGYDDVATIISNSRAKIFNFPYPIFEEDYKSVLETKILKHYYTREIGEETVGLWKLRLDAKLNEIMPYYNKLYVAQIDDINPFYSTDLKTERQTVGSSNRKTGEEIGDVGSNASTSYNESEGTNANSTTNRSLDSSENKVTSRGLTDSGEVKDSKSMDLYSDTPQGSLTGIDADVPTYLTNARKVTNHDIGNGHTYSLDTGESNTNSNSLNVGENNGSESATQKGAQTSTNSFNRDRNVSEDANTTERFVEHTYGYNGYLPAEILKKYRDVIWNIDMMIIEELEPLFMQLW